MHGILDKCYCKTFYSALYVLYLTWKMQHANPRTLSVVEVDSHEVLYHVRSAVAVHYQLLEHFTASKTERYVQWMREHESNKQEM